MERMLASLDQFRVISKELTTGRGITGGWFTAIAYAVLVTLLIAELRSFLMVTYVTDVFMDDNNERLMLLNFDITLFDLPCKHTKVAIFDEFGDEKINSTQDIKYMPLDHSGQYAGKPYTPEEITMLEQADKADDIAEEERVELDADWASTSDHFKHQDFHKAVAFHDYTLVNFYADWCGHCRHFYPMWVDMRSKISEKMSFADAEGRSVTVKFMRINCVDFASHCQSAQIAAFPTVRLYKSDGTFEAFRSKRNYDSFVDFLSQTIKKSHLAVAQHHAMFSEGCRVQGQVSLPRVPGHFYMYAEAHGDENVNPALANISHMVSHLSFGDPESRARALRRQSVPRELLANIAPLDGKQFIATHFHEAPQHYLKVVRTSVEGGGGSFYQMTVTDRLRRLKDMKRAPKARFTYDFSPLSVVVRERSRRWYEFATSLCAILGGTYTVVELFSGAVDSVHGTIKESLGKTT